jgi:hypothetical protein
LSIFRALRFTKHAGNLCGSSHFTFRTIPKKTHYRTCIQACLNQNFNPPFEFLTALLEHSATARIAGGESLEPSETVRQRRNVTKIPSRYPSRSSACLRNVNHPKGIGLLVRARSCKKNPEDGMTRIIGDPAS